MGLLELWFVLGGFILGYLTSYIWEVLYGRRRRSARGDNDFKQSAARDDDAESAAWQGPIDDLSEQSDRRPRNESSDDAFSKPQDWDNDNLDDGNLDDGNWDEADWDDGNWDEADWDEGDRDEGDRDERERDLSTVRVERPDSDKHSDEHGDKHDDEHGDKHGDKHGEGYSRNYTGNDQPKGEEQHTVVAVKRDVTRAAAHESINEWLDERRHIGHTQQRTLDARHDRQDDRPSAERDDNSEASDWEVEHSYYEPPTYGERADEQRDAYRQTQRTEMRQEPAPQERAPQERATMERASWQGESTSDEFNGGAFEDEDEVPTVAGLSAQQSSAPGHDGTVIIADSAGDARPRRSRAELREMEARAARLAVPRVRTARRAGQHDEANANTSTAGKSTAGKSTAGESTAGESTADEGSSDKSRDGSRAGGETTTASDNHPDALTAIKGIGARFQERLFHAGVYTWRQIAETDETLLAAAARAPVGTNLTSWKEQARALAVAHSRQEAHYDGPLPNDLTAIDGIGARHEAVLYGAGIATYELLANCSPHVLRTLFPIESLDLSNWQQQASELFHQLEQSEEGKRGN